MKYIPVLEGRSPVSGRKAGCRPSGTVVMSLPLNPPINRWAIRVLSSGTTAVSTGHPGV
ncbi:MAG: hypothetical protein GY801_53435 [bacterium]|nr:hypothetical protein [bacterium]